MEKSLKIKDWAEDDRPREKLLAKGAQTLSDAELLAILISSGTQNETALDLAKRLLANANNNLSALGQKSVADFKQIKGIGTAKAVSIAAALELGRRRNTNGNKAEQITCSVDLFNVFQPLLCDLNYEESWILLLNRANKIIGKQKICQGGISETVVDIRLCCKTAVENLASAVAFAHNHPSKNATPSNEDKLLTNKLKTALKMFDINLIDHLIVCGNSYFSFADENLL